MQLPKLSPVEAIALGIFAKATFDSAVAALPKPTKSAGFYCWLVAFTTGEKSAVDGFLDARFHIPAGQSTYTTSGVGGATGVNVAPTK